MATPVELAGTVRNALAFFRSVIKSGENWSEVCESESADASEAINELVKGFRWQEMVENYKDLPVGPKVFYYPPITGRRHPSNNRPESYSTDYYFGRRPSHFAPLEAPE